MTRITADEYNAQRAQVKRNKYGARRVIVDGITFDSDREAKRWALLQLRVKAGEITDLERQVKVPLFGRDGPLLTRTGRHMRITLDFAYREHDGRKVYEDSKGMPTRDYEVRRAVAAAQGVEIIEV